MPDVEVTIPTMLATLVGEARTFEVEAGDVEGVLEAVFARHPELRVHILDETGDIRPHVMLFHNDTGIRDRARPVADNDRVTVLQAVSGG